MARSAVITASFIAAALLLQPAVAQTLYKSTLPDGSVVYGDKPAPDAVKVEETRPDISKGGIGGTTPREAEALKQMEKARGKREESESKVEAAEKALRDAEAARAAGKEPLASERIGTAGGASRITDDYYARQKKLDDAVEKARRELDQARSGK
jgi:hypothetical protein